MATTTIRFFEDKTKAVEEFSYWDAIPGMTVAIFGPTTLLTGASMQVSGVEEGKEYYVIIAGDANAAASPQITPPV